MAVSWTALEQGNIYTYIVQKYGVGKTAAWGLISTMMADTVNMLLLPNPASWAEVWQCADACVRKQQGLSPIVRTILEILGSLIP